MRGFRALGKVELVSPHDFDGGDLLFFSPDRFGFEMRANTGIRARDFDLFTCQTFVATGQVPNDYVFVATAIGEECFK
jgi:hypothetical protein